MILARSWRDARKEFQGAVIHSAESVRCLYTAAKQTKKKRGVRRTQSTLTVFPRFVSSARPKVIWRMPLR